MKITHLLAISVFFMFTLSSCKSYHEKFAEQGIQRMTNTELKALLENGWEARFEIKSTTGSVSYKADGSASGKWEGEAHQGVWNLNGDQFCTKWDAGDRCYHLYQTEPGVFTLMKMDGSIRGQIMTL